jgi:tRNA nucleotidyltransferase/poly(A) polymerase
VDNKTIIKSLSSFRSLFSCIAFTPNKLIQEISSMLPSRYMVFPCDLIDMRLILKNQAIKLSNPLPLFSLQFAKKYLKEYSVFLFIDTHKIHADIYKFGGLLLNNTNHLDISDSLLRIVVNEPSSNGGFEVIKNMVKEFDIGVECLVSNSVPGISAPSKKLSITNTKKNVLKISQAIQNSDLDLTSKEKNIFNFLRQVKKDRNLNIQMRVAGGWVRDKLLGKESDDIDIAINMPGYDFAKIVAEESVKYGISKIPKAYKVSLDKAPDAESRNHKDDLMVGAVNLFGQKIEFVPMRTEFYPDKNSRQPSIKMTNDPKEDVKRRDLTINAIYYNIDTGKIDDFVGGMRDLDVIPHRGKTGIRLRTPDEAHKTFMEDPLRLLRVLRFHSRYPNSYIEPSIIEAMQDPEVQESYVKKVAPERAGPEIMKMLSSDNPVSSLRLLFTSGLYKNVFRVPEMEDIHEQGIMMDQMTPFHKYNLLDHTLETVKNMNQIMKDNGEDDHMRGLMNMAALFHDFGKMKKGIQQPNETDNSRMSYLEHENSSKDMCDAILKSIGVGQDERDIVNQVVSLHMKPHEASKWRNKGKRKFRDATRMHGKEDEHKDLWKYIFYHSQADAMSSIPENYDPEERQRTFNEFQKFIDSPVGSFQGSVLNGYEIMSIFPQLEPRSGFISEVQEYVQELQDEGVIDIQDESNAKQIAIIKVQEIAPQIINKYSKESDKESSMGKNWFKKAQTPTVSRPRLVPQENDPDIRKGPVKAKPKYYVGMKVRDRRKGAVNPQDYGVVNGIKGNKVKILWNPDSKDRKKEEIYDMVEDTAILSMIVTEV